MSLKVLHGISYRNKCTQSQQGEVRQNSFQGERESKALILTLDLLWFP